MRLLPLLLLLSLPALARDIDTVNVSSSTPTNVTTNLDGRAAYKTIMVENGGTNAIYCAKDESVTTNTGHKVNGSDGWRAFPYEGPLYCIAASADQTGTSRDKTIVWGSYQ
jgi:hypothetical protein